MGWLASIFIGLITAVIGCVGAGLLANLCANWYRVSSFEGAAGYMVVLVALLGLVAGLILGIVCARIVAGWEHASFLKGLGLATGIAAGLLLVSTGFAWLGADFAPTIDGRDLEVVFEVRGAKDFTGPGEIEKDKTYVAVYLPGGRRQPAGELKLGSAQQVEGRWIIPGLVPLQTSASSKFLRVRLSDKHDLMFALRLPRRPQKSDMEWSDWVESGWDVGKPRPSPEENFFLRYRVQLEKA